MCKHENSRVICYSKPVIYILKKLVHYCVEDNKLLLNFVFFRSLFIGILIDFCFFSEISMTVSFLTMQIPFR